MSRLDGESSKAKTFLKVPKISDLFWKNQKFTEKNNDMKQNPRFGLLI